MSRSPLSEPSTSLRERKKQKTRWSIQEHALRLFAAQGYDATTVDEIAAAAEISPSTFFRYFRTKEDVVLQDEYDDLMAEVFLTEPAELPTVTAFRHTVRRVFAQVDAAAWAQLRERTVLIMSTPALRGRQMDSIAATFDLFTQTVATRLHRSADDPESRAIAGACIGVCTAVAIGWVSAGAAGDLAADLDFALARLDSGFAV